MRLIWIPNKKYDAKKDFFFLALYSQLQKYWDMVSILIVLDINITTIDLKWNKQPALTVDFHFLFESIYIQIRWIVKEWKQFACMPLTFWNMKRKRSNRNQKPHFHSLILGWNPLQSITAWSLDRTGDIYITRCCILSLVMCCQGSTATVFSSCLLWPGALSLQFCLQSQASSIRFRLRSSDLIWPIANIPLFCFKKVFGCFHFMIRVIVHLHGEELPTDFWSWFLADNQIGQNTSEFILRLQSTITSWINTSEPVLLTAISAHQLQHRSPDLDVNTLKKMSAMKAHLSFQIYCGGVESQKDRNCVDATMFMVLTAF